MVSLKSIAEKALYLIQQHDFSYVLLGKLQCDPIEGRFGMYHELNGAPYFVRVRQILLAEKKISLEFD